MFCWLQHLNQSSMILLHHSVSQVALVLLQGLVLKTFLSPAFTANLRLVSSIAPLLQLASARKPHTLTQPL